MTWRRARTSVAVLLSATTIAAPLAVRAQAKGQSDRAVTLLMDFAFNTIPRQFRQPNGEVITIDRTKKNEIMVPLEKAREIVTVADRSARAQYCNLPEEQSANFQSMMQREVASDRWTKQQLVFITLLHVSTVAYLTGSMRVTFEGDGEAGSEMITKGPVWTEPCTDRLREDIKSRVLAYINEAVAIPAAKGEQPAQRVEPISGTITK
ncbi:MAG TPA: hypothetical protein VLL28_00455 [Hyphomicrobiaceae bacterium]|jgi:hypothetical protein|nr:hypothetical protein [Hyphomicrobiaceae bacterium]